METTNQTTKEAISLSVQNGLRRGFFDALTTNGPLTACESIPQRKTMQAETTLPCFEHRHLVTFGDTNVAANVYFAKYFFWQEICREVFLAEQYPEFEEDLRRGFGFATEFAHMDFFQEARLFDQVIMRLTLGDLSRTRIEMAFEFIREPEGTLLARGRQAVVWVNPQHRPSLMPDRLFDAVADFFGVAEVS